MIATLTLNPALDKSTKVDLIRPESKLRCDAPKFDPGGGGINVARAIKKLGGDAKAIYLGGGFTAEILEDLLQKEGVDQERIPIQNWTRENFTVVDMSSNQQFRYVMPGPEISEKEWQSALDYIKNLAPDYLVASGGLAPGMPDDFYARVAHIGKKNGSRVIIDTHGDPLLAALEEGVFLIKPNLRELGIISGDESVTEASLNDSVQKIIQAGQAEIVVVSLGPRGAMLVNNEISEHVIPPTMPKKSTVGAGDSMVAGMVYALDRGERLEEVLQRGVATGTAATMNEGTELCRKEDVEEVYKHLIMRRNA